MSAWRMQKITFEDALPLWTERLWPNRQSSLREKSSMTYEGGIDMKIYEGDPPEFWGAFLANGLVGVNSGFWTAPGVYRSRGLYVLEAHRRQGIGEHLLSKTIETAKQKKAQMVWSLPRLGILPIYEKVGFQTVGAILDQGMEFGPNIKVKLEL